MNLLNIFKWRPILVLLLVSLFPQVFAWSQASGTFMVVKGDVQVTSKNGATVKARVGQKVVPADIIVAGKESRAKIVMSDKNVINISPETKMALETYVYDPGSNNKQVTLNVAYGKIRATVEQKYDGEKNKFHIKTPSAVAGVRGTDFVTSFNQVSKQTKIVTFEGNVAVGLPGPAGQILNPVFVPPGQMTVAAAGAAPTPPQVIPPQEFNQLKMESLAEPSKSEGPGSSNGSGGPAAAPSKDSSNSEGDSTKPDEKKIESNQEKPKEGKESREDMKNQNRKPTSTEEKSPEDRNANGANNAGNNGEKNGLKNDSKGAQRRPSTNSVFIRGDDMVPPKEPLMPGQTEMPRVPVNNMIPRDAMTQPGSDQLNETIRQINNAAKVNITIERQ